MSDTSGAVIDATPESEPLATETTPELDTSGAGAEVPPVVETTTGGEPGELPEGETAPEVDATHDWGTRVTEWGGEEAVESAVRLADALTTPEGVKALFIEAGQALGLGRTAIDELLGAEPEGETEETIEDLLADPGRQLTVGEMTRLREHWANEEKTSSTQASENARVSNAITATMTKLGVAEEDHAYILKQADALVAHLPGYATDAQIEDAITKADAAFKKRVADAAAAIVKAKGAVHEELPSPLPNTGGGGSTPADSEPQSIAEAKRQVREARPEAFAR